MRLFVHGVAEARLPGAAGVRRLALSGLLLAGATAAANALNASFHLVLARVLDPAEYSLLATLLALVLVLAVPTLAVQPAVARAVARALKERGDPAAGLVLRSTFRLLVRVTAVGVAVAAVLAYPLALLVNVEDPLPVAATAATLLASVAVPAAWGGLQGAERFAMLGAAQLGWATLRLAAGVGVGLAGGGAGAVMLGVAVATAATFAVSLLPLRPLLAAASGVAPALPRVPWRWVLGAAGGLTVFAALTTADLLAARVVFEPETSGAYAAASVGARLLLLAPVAVTTVVFPRVATLADPLRERRYLLGGLAVVGAAGLVGTAAMIAAPELLLRIGFGSGYEEAEGWLGPLAGAMALYALVNVYLFHFLSLGRTRLVVALAVLLAAQLAGFALFHGRPGELIAVQVAVALAALAACEVYDWRGRA